MVGKLQLVSRMWLADMMLCVALLAHLQVAIAQIDSKLLPHIQCLLHLSSYLHEFIMLNAKECTRVDLGHFM